MYVSPVLVDAQYSAADLVLTIRHIVQCPKCKKIYAVGLKQSKDFECDCDRIEAGVAQ